jgi:hypothetical protein
MPTNGVLDTQTLTMGDPCDACQKNTPKNSVDKAYKVIQGATEYE